ncbi:hypothetical protein BCR41DRAFT_401061 [Lobosporangium transversale]|uniref:Zinc finger PHD-type domain-containing protein n=1 Tax=Lobosporangium transversale TaxID=64571 RepID=A0A1Y2GB90_9FUNG|nr:hypothetical protein BCR41DRAFT_401061 [Lobosporangium transversale]ORZ04388.1 hypothetical protein BCR41DRAFT_401061 [Lobosporangium transversale]|eukprot:XP_021876496.1 hypothetical protein BCR41DRAFT_401061 [Lobosporangium transversale]
MPTSSALSLVGCRNSTCHVSTDIIFDNWFKYAQKEYEKREDLENPWLEEEATHYEGFSLATKLSILSNLCEWQLDDPERFRAYFKEEEEVAVEWRVDPIGYDAMDRTYWLFDDNRLYRENPLPKKNTKATEQPIVPSKAKAKVKTAVELRRGTRRSTRGQRAEEILEPEPEPEFETPPITPGVQWEPICITKEEWEDFAKIFHRSKHSDEKALYALINNDILPKVLSDFREKEKEREKLEAIANRKRSSRIVIRELELQEKARLEAIRQQELQTAAEQRKREIRERRAEKERLLQQQVRDSRQKEREMRLKAREDAIWEREMKKKQQQQKIAKEREARQSRRLGSNHKEDHSENESIKYQDEDEEEDWVFDCVCGVHGNNLDDGELMIACGKCNVWQHVACLKQEDAAQGKTVKDWETVDFTCSRCIAKEKKKAARKKRGQKLKMETLAATVVLPGVTKTTPNGIQGQVLTPAPAPVGKKEVKRKKVPVESQAHVASSAISFTNGHYLQSPHHHATSFPVQPYSSQPQSYHSQSAPYHVSPTHHPTSFSGQPYSPQPQPQPQPYHSQTPYQQSLGIIHAPQTFYSGHPTGIADNQLEQAHQHYGYQNAHLMQPQHYLYLPHQQQQTVPSQYRQPYQGEPHQFHQSDVLMYSQPTVSPGYRPGILAPGSAGMVQKRVNSGEDDIAMEGMERPSKMMINHHHHQT